MRLLEEDGEEISGDQEEDTKVRADFAGGYIKK